MTPVLTTAVRRASLSVRRTGTLARRNPSALPPGCALSRPPEGSGDLIHPAPIVAIGPPLATRHASGGQSPGRPPRGGAEGEVIGLPRRPSANGGCREPSVARPPPSRAQRANYAASATTK